MACILTDSKAFKDWQAKNFPTVNSSMLAINISLWQKAKNKTAFPTKMELNAYRKEHNWMPIENVFQEKSNDKLELTLPNYDRYNTNYNREETKPIKVAGTLASYTQELDIMLGVAMDQNNPNEIASRVNLIKRALKSDSLDSLLEEIKNDKQKDSIANQLVSHLETIGITVLGRQDMEKYLSTHNPEYLQQALAGSQLKFARGVKAPKGVEKYLLSSAIMTQANTFEHLTEDLQNNIGSIAKRVILFGNNAYLWSTENGYEFFIEQSLPIDEENYDKINNLLNIYGTDEIGRAHV